MRRFGVVSKTLIATLLTILLTGCDQDPLRLAQHQIVGSYYLERWEDFETFYVIDRDVSYELMQGGGAIDGTAVLIGWNDQAILIQRHSLVGGHLGWIIIDPTAHRVTGPFSDADIAQNPRLSGIHPIPANQAWDSLPWKLF